MIPKGPEATVAPDGPRPGWGGGWRRLVFPGVFLVYVLQTANGVADHASGATAVVGYVLIVVFCAAYLAGLVALWTAERRRLAMCAAVMVAVCAVEAVIAHEDAFVMFVYIGVLAIAALWERSVPIVVGLVLVAIFVPPLVPSWHHGLEVEDGFTLAIILLAMYAFFAVIRANHDLSVARGEIARLAAEGERARIARDLHDLLGHSLTTITVKSALAGRLLGRDPERARAEVGEVERLARQALTDVRAAVSGYRDVTVAGELAAGAELLRTVGITAQLPPSTEIVDPAHHELFGWVVREGITNVVRHSRATWCAVTLGRHWIEIVDDGLGGGLGPAGSGLAGLQERVEASGAVLTVAPRTPHGWRLRVDAAAPDPPAPPVHDDDPAAAR